MPKRGKKLTVAQMKLINHALGNDIDVTEWLYYSTESINDDGSKHAAKNSSNTRYMKIINKYTNEIKQITI